MQLRVAVLAETGGWTTKRARVALESTGFNITARQARRLLDQLGDEGLPAKPGSRGSLWRRTPRMVPAA